VTDKAIRIDMAGIKRHLEAAIGCHGR
jgi:hypothetical protein